MTNSVFTLIIFVLFIYSPSSSNFSKPKNNKSPKKLIGYVDPLIGVEDGGGATLPGACLPFSMVRLSPDTPLPQNTSGYVPGRPIDGAELILEMTNVPISKEKEVPPPSVSLVR